MKKLLLPTMLLMFGPSSSLAVKPPKAMGTIMVTQLPVVVPAVAAKRLVAVTAVVMKSAALRKHAAKMGSRAAAHVAVLKRQTAMDPAEVTRRNPAVVHAEAPRRSTATDPAASLATICESIS